MHSHRGLLLPMAIPAYIMAYSYTGLLDFAGPVQSQLRLWFHWSYGDYYFPEIRSLPGAILMLSLVLYPYEADQSAVLQLSRAINDEFHVIPQSDISRWPYTFSHIFAGGYAAGYYSYKWAEVLSADAYAAFEEAAEKTGSILNAEVGQRYQREILAVGGSRSAAESFVAFRGREPEIDALLRHGGLA